MKTSDFDFDLPPDRIAAQPTVPRDAARLLFVGHELADRLVSDLPRLLRPGDLMVFNDTKVIPGLLRGERHAARGHARIEITLLEPLAGAPAGDGRDARRWLALARPAKRLQAGDDVTFGPGFSARVSACHENGAVTLDFTTPGLTLLEALERFGAMPLPPYIRKLRPVRNEDAADYQTVYAAKTGAVAAPTAGLHFTPDLLAALDAAGVERACVTLHVGAGTFLPVKVADLALHQMHAEWGAIPAATADSITRARREGRRVIAVGTTSLRLLETAADDTGAVAPFAGTTRIFITPGYRFKAVDLLMTNFHLPRSTLFMLTAAFAGLARMKAAYRHAIDSGYRFYSFGDASLLERAS